MISLMADHPRPSAKYGEIRVMGLDSSRRGGLLSIYPYSMQRRTIAETI